MMAFRDELVAKVEEIVSTSLRERNGYSVPEPKDVAFDEAVKLDASVLYADIADSTLLVDKHKPFFSARVYKAFLHCAASIIRNRGGSITAYDGDRVMGVFIGAGRNTSAAWAALNIKYAVKEIINPALVAKWPTLEYRLKHVVGVDTSPLYVARTGVRGDNDLVWIGRAANYAAKLAALPESFSSYITGDVYQDLEETARTTKGERMWTPLIWNDFNNATIYASTWRSTP